jgi:hypothetical protein
MRLPRIALPGVKFKKRGPFPEWELMEREIVPEQELTGVEVKPIKPQDTKLVFRVIKNEKGEDKP